jgi:hypothetical protein
VEQFPVRATCEANGINPLLYPRDVLLRVQTHPASRIDALLAIGGSSNSISHRRSAALEIMANSTEEAVVSKA